MLLAFVELGFPVVVCHVNYGLRGEDSEGDAFFVRELCKKLGVKCHVLSVNESSGYGKQMGESTQIWARRLRYDFFQKIMEEEGASHLAVAHHLQDHLEHLFIYLSRGQNHHAFSGMRIESGRLIRPMLKVKPSAILEFMKQRGAGWREDSSNASMKYLRNKVRWRIVKPLLDENEAILDEFLLSSQHFQTTYHEIQQQFDVVWPIEELKNGWWFELSDRWLRWGVIDDVLRSLGFTGSDIDQFFAQKTKVGAYKEAGNFVICRERNSRILVYQKVEIADLEGVWRLYIPREWKKKKVEIRGWQLGDKIQVRLGERKARKKISDLFVDWKWNRMQKQRCRLLVVDGEIMAVEGAQGSMEMKNNNEQMLEILVHGKNIGYAFGND